MDHHDNKYTINFKHFPQDANARCHSLEQIILFLDVKSLANFILTSAIAQYDGNSISMFSVVRLNKFKTDMMYELNRKYLDPYPNCTPYIVACELGHFDDFKKFVTIGNIDINSTGKNRTGWNGGYTSLLIATQYEHIDIVKYLLTFDHININASNDSGMSALHTAAYHNTNHEIIQMFIMHPNLNINSQNSQGWTSVCIFMYNIVYIFYKTNFLLYKLNCKSL